MKWLGIIVRTFVGAVFLFFSLNFFFNFLDMSSQGANMPDEAKQFGGLLFSSGYMKVVKVLELVGGFLLFTGLFVGLGITILTPISVNIMLFELCLTKQPGPGVVLTVLCAVLIGVYWKHFRGAFSMKPMAGCSHG
ncbi:hypothetical protein [Zavarzinella formosa]|uniref:hypothetical protein n=1 Tax=Zavarzinella formosa TaxID=360055 RepID=UPI000304D5BA|nr:hypothetical protein [Zavarzinella formosa]